MPRLKGLNRAAISSVEATTARVNCSPVRTTETRCNRTMPPEVERHERYREQAVDEGAIDEEVYLVEAVAKDGDADRCRKGG
jgi:hypothetical protein